MANQVIQGQNITYRIVKQSSTTSGVPTTPEFYVMPRVDGDITDNPNFTKSNRVDTTRQNSENIITSLPIDGSFNDELAIADPVTHLILEGTLQGEFGTETDYTASTISFVNGTSTIDDTADLAFADAVVGQFLVFSGSADNDRVFRITSKTDDGTVVVAPAPTDESAGASITVKGKMARSGKNEIGYTIQKEIPTTTTPVYETFENCQFATFSTTQTTESIFTTSYSVMGTDKVDGTSAIAGQTDATVDYERVLGSVNGIPYIWVDNVPTATKELMATNVSISIDNGTQGISVLNSLGYGAIMHNLIAVTGDYNTIADKANPLSEKLKATNSTLFSLALELTDVNGNKMMITRDSTMYTSLTQTETGNGTVYSNTATTESDGKNNTYLTTIQIDYLEA